jgi:molybdopterin converting factor small subunit
VGGPRAGAAVGRELIAGLDARVPGLADRLLAAGPSIREHINVFVDGDIASLDTAVAPGSTAHVIPAVSGGWAGGTSGRTCVARPSRSTATTGAGTRPARCSSVRSMIPGRSQRAGARTRAAPVARTASATPSQPGSPGSHTLTAAPASAISVASARSRLRERDPV